MESELELEIGKEYDLMAKGFSRKSPVKSIFLGEFLETGDLYFRAISPSGYAHVPQGFLVEKGLIFMPSNSSKSIVYGDTEHVKKIPALVERLKSLGEVL